MGWISTMPAGTPASSSGAASTETPEATTTAAPGTVPTLTPDTPELSGQFQEVSGILADAEADDVAPLPAWVVPIPEVPEGVDPQDVFGYDTIPRFAEWSLEWLEQYGRECKLGKGRYSGMSFLATVQENRDYHLFLMSLEEEVPEMEYFCAWASAWRIASPEIMQTGAPYHASLEARGNTAVVSNGNHCGKTFVEVCMNHVDYIIWLQKAVARDSSFRKTAPGLLTWYEEWSKAKTADTAGVSTSASATNASADSKDRFVKLFLEVVVSSFLFFFVLKLFRHARPLI